LTQQRALAGPPPLPRPTFGNLAADFALAFAFAAVTLTFNDPLCTAFDLALAFGPVVRILGPLGLYPGRLQTLQPDFEK